MPSRDDCTLIVGGRREPSWMRSIPMIGQVFRDKADVLVLGSPGQDLVGRSPDSGGDDIASWNSLALHRRHCRQHLEVTGVLLRR